MLRSARPVELEIAAFSRIGLFAARSAIRFTRITSTPKISVNAEIVGKSRAWIDETSSDPSPGIANTLSITTIQLIR